MGKALQKGSRVHSWALGVLNLEVGWVAGFPVGSSQPPVYRKKKKTWKSEMLRSNERNWP